MKLLALDLSLTNAGVSRLVDVRAGQPVWDVETVLVPGTRVPGKKAGTTKSGGVLQGVVRLDWWEKWLVEEIADGAELIVLEAPAYSAPRAHHIAKLYGVLELACYRREVAFLTVNIQQIKQWATGMGNADKQRMIDTATEALGGEVTLNEHEADAYWLGRLAYAVWGGGEPDTPGRCALAKLLRKGEAEI